MAVDIYIASGDEYGITVELKLVTYDVFFMHPVIEVLIFEIWYFQSVFEIYSIFNQLFYQVWIDI